MWWILSNIGQNIILKQYNYSPMMGQMCSLEVKYYRALTDGVLNDIWVQNISLWGMISMGTVQ